MLVKECGMTDRRRYDSTEKSSHERIGGFRRKPDFERNVGIALFAAYLCLVHGSDHAMLGKRHERRALKRAGYEFQRADGGSGIGNSRIRKRIDLGRRRGKILYEKLIIHQEIPWNPGNR